MVKTRVVCALCGEIYPIAPGKRIAACAHVDCDGEPCHGGAAYTPKQQAANLEALLAEVGTW